MAVSKGADAIAKETEKLEAYKQARAKEHDKRTSAEQTLQAAEMYLKENACDEWLISGLAGVSEQFSNLIVKQRDITQKKSDVDNADAALADASKKLKEASKQCSVKNTNIRSQVW